MMSYLQCKSCGAVFSKTALRNRLQKIMNEEYGMNVELYDSGALSDPPIRIYLNYDDIHYSTCPNCRKSEGYHEVEKRVNDETGEIEYINKEVLEMKLKITKSNGDEFKKPLIPVGTYEIRFINVKDWVDPKTNKVKYIWEFEVLDDKGNVIQDNGQDVVLSYWTSDVITEKSKAGELLQKLGANIEEEFDTDDLIGNTVKALIETFKRDDGTKFSVISKLVEE